MKLLKKELKLCMHPFGYIAPLLSALILVPGYPYGVCCFYTLLGVFFVCLSARENHDASYTLSLPVSRRDAVLGRILLCLCMELFQLLVMGLFILVKKAIGTKLNPAGLDAGLALMGEDFLIYALFNMIFFPVYYKDINKPGFAFMIGSIAVFVWIVAEIIATYAVPFVRDILDRPDPEYMGDKALFTLGTFVLFAAGSCLAWLKSAKKFDEVDLAL